MKVKSCIEKIAKKWKKKSMTTSNSQLCIVTDVYTTTAATILYSIHPFFDYIPNAVCMYSIRMYYVQILVQSYKIRQTGFVHVIIVLKFLVVFYRIFIFSLFASLSGNKSCVQLTTFFSFCFIENFLYLFLVVQIFTFFLFFNLKLGFWQINKTFYRHRRDKKIITG